MRIFVAYGYNERDHWIPDLVFPIIRAFGDEVITGEELQGERITDAVIRNIQQADALIAFLTRREPMADNQWTTHRWVTDEFAQAIHNLLVVEVRESGVDSQAGIGGDRQRIVYNKTERDQCLVELVKTIGKWHQKRTLRIQIQLLSDQFVQDIGPLLNHPDLRCTYRILSDDKNSDSDISQEMPINIIRKTGGLFINVRNIPRQSSIEVCVRCLGRVWRSAFHSTDWFGIYLQEDKQQWH